MGKELKWKDKLSSAFYPVPNGTEKNPKAIPNEYNEQNDKNGQYNSKCDIDNHKSNDEQNCVESQHLFKEKIDGRLTGKGVDRQE